MDMIPAPQQMQLDEKSELGEVFDNLDRDIVDKDTKMSSIDFNTRLSSLQICNTMVIDELTRLGILPNDIGITRQIKRLQVSLNGQGRSEKVKIVVGERDRESGGGFMKNLLSKRDR